MKKNCEVTLPRMPWCAKKTFFPISSSSSNLKVSKTIGGSRERTRGAHSPSYFRPNWGRKGGNFFLRPPPLISGSGWPPPPPPPRFLNVWIRHCILLSLLSDNPWLFHFIPRYLWIRWCKCFCKEDILHCEDWLTENVLATARNPKDPKDVFKTTTTTNNYVCIYSCKSDLRT